MNAGTTGPVLAIETASSVVGVAVADETGVLGAVAVRAGRRHAETLHPAIGQLLRAAGLGLADLGAVAVDVGPGLFTGIRVGMAAAKGFAAGLGIGLVGRTSLGILAASVQAAGGLPLPVVDLRRGEIAWMVPGEGPRHGTPAELAGLLGPLGKAAAAEGRPLVLAGDGALRYSAELVAGLESGKGGVLLPGAELAAPPVASLAVIAVAELAAGRTVTAEALEPVYLREADVRINWSTRHDAPGPAGASQ